MKTRFLPVLAVCVSCFPAWAEAASPGCASVEVQNVRPQQGRLMVAAFTTAETFRKDAVSALTLQAGAATMRFDVCGLLGDTVSLTLFQDLNSDGKLNTNLVGMPNEPWGASGHPGMTGPTWDSAKVALDGQPIVVRMSQ